MTKARSDNLDYEPIEAQELERRRIIDATNALATLLLQYHLDHMTEIATEPCTDRPKRMQPEPNIQTGGWPFE